MQEACYVSGRCYRYSVHAGVNRLGFCRWFILFQMVQEDDECCNNCEEVREAYRKKGWALTNPDLVDQVTPFCATLYRIVYSIGFNFDTMYWIEMLFMRYECNETGCLQLLGSTCGDVVYYMCG